MIFDTCLRTSTVVIVFLAVLLYWIGWPAWSLSTTALLLGKPLGLPLVTPAAPGGTVITGCSGNGLGRHASEELARSGHTVFCSVRKQKDKEILDALGIPTLYVFLMDVTKQEEVDRFAANVILQLGGDPLLGLVNNAGVSEHVPIEFTDFSSFHRVMDVNLLGVIRLTKAFAAALRKSKSRVVNVGSIRGLIAGPDAGVYGMSKFALESLTDSFRMEMSYHGVSVSMINPGYIKSEIGKKQVGKHSVHSQLTKEQMELYEFLPCVEKKRIAADETAGHPMEVTSAIKHALFSSFPRYRYTMGKTGKFMAAWFSINANWYLPRVIVDIMYKRKVKCD